MVVSTTNVGPHVDNSSQTLTLFEGFPAQKSRLFNALFEPQGPENHTLFSGTYPLRANKGVTPLPPPPRPRCNPRMSVGFIRCCYN